MNARFLSIIETTLANEGGYSFDLDDPGGETRWGISKRSYPYLSIRDLTRKQAIEIYYRDYFVGPGIYRIADYALCRKVFDIGCNTGPGRSIKFLQGACNLFGADLEVDGVLGVKTAEWVTGYRYPKALESAFEILAGNHYIRIGNPKFLAGWLIRLDE